MAFIGNITVLAAVEDVAKWLIFDRVIALNWWAT